MSNRRLDAAYLMLILLVSSIGYYASNRSSDEGKAFYLAPYSISPLSFEIPFDFPYALIEFEHLVSPTLNLSEDMESALNEVRSALLRSSTLVETGSMQRLGSASISMEQLITATE